MEEQFINATNICSDFLHQYFLPKLFKQTIPANKQVKQYSCIQSSLLTAGLLRSSSYHADEPIDRFVSDFEVKPFDNNESKLVPKIKEPKTKIKHKTSYVAYPSVPIDQNPNEDHPKLLPLNQENSFGTDSESEEMAEKLRKRKFQQVYYRNKYEQNFKNLNAKIGKAILINCLKHENKSGSGIGIYDYNGQIIQGSKNGEKALNHFVHLEVVVGKESQTQDNKGTNLTQKPKIKKVDYFWKDYYKQNGFKRIDNNFLRPLSENQLSPGVELTQQKSQHPKKPYTLKTDKKNNFSCFNSEANIQKIKLQDLISLKAAKQKVAFQRNNKENEGVSNEKIKSILEMSQHFKNQGGYEKTIKINNRAALEQLVNDQFEDQAKTQDLIGKKSNFKRKKKNSPKTVHIND